jgi:hypothetical protein
VLWSGVWGEWGHVLRPALLGLVVALVVIRLLVRVRMLRGVPRQRAWRHSVAEVGMIAGTAPWVWMILTPRPGDRALSLVPFRDLAAQLGGPVAGVVVQVGGNLLVLAALGFFLPLRFRLAPDTGRHAVAVLTRVAVLAAGVSATVEALQYVLDLGRVASVDDVLVNTVGAVLAALCSRRWWL